MPTFRGNPPLYNSNRARSENKMDKQVADNLINAYLPKIYAFAIKKAFSYTEAEERGVTFHGGWCINKIFYTNQ